MVADTRREIKIFAQFPRKTFPTVRSVGRGENAFQTRPRRLHFSNVVRGFSLAVLAQG
jgi:hypothetical protein